MIEKIETDKEVGNTVTEDTLENVKQALEDDKELMTELVVENVVINNVEQETQTIVEQAVGEIKLEDNKKIEIAQYMDISILIKEAGGAILGTLDELPREITITLAIPNEWKEEGYTFHMVRIHDGKADILPVKENENGTISIKTSKFSIYALAYEDVKENSDNSGTQTPDTDNPNSGTQTPGTDTPNSGTQTPDTNNPNSGTQTPDTNNPNSGTQTPGTNTPNSGTSTSPNTGYVGSNETVIFILIVLVMTVYLYTKKQKQF